MPEGQELKSTVQITIAGRPKSGKTTVLSLVARYLGSLGFDVDIKWGLDDDPRYHKEDDELLARKRDLALSRTKIVITEQQLPRQKSEG